ncbi:3-oxoacyl-ACP synthase [Pseudomonas sp. SK3(2021)]|uniref:hypothetical protein n=1 Tax=Pseudomonas sp. SK3(2021) TaxID=2841064 RepID=UPI00192A9A58|nr:hypothetical protein [Pseudomonas sp. SK3(2021)]QQZ41618.1 3-oxoacyl-ACP synthase [Pseudomonas sp. SK3(2021)]
MSLGGQLSVLGHAMLTALGADGPSTCAAMRAGISGAREANLWDFTVGENLQAARTRMHQWWEGPTMVPELAAPVIRQCWQQALQLGLAQGTDDAPAVPVLIILPPVDRPHRSPELDQLVLDGLAQRFGHPLPQGSRTVAHGRTGILPALRTAHELLSNHVAAACIVVGVESFLRQVLVEHYIEQDRLLCGTHSNGFMPGEAACAVLVARHGTHPADELVIVGTGSGQEPSGDGGSADNPVRGEGLTQAIRQALSEAGIVFHDLNFSISDLNGEHFKFKEAAFAAGRLDRLPPDGHSRRPRGFMETWHPVEGIGEVGAAIFPCLLGWAFEAGLKGYAPSQHALLHAGEDNGERVALVTRFEHKGAN